VAHQRGLVITLVVAVVLAVVGIGVMELTTNDTDDSVQEEVASDAYAGTRPFGLDAAETASVSYAVIVENNSTGPRVFVIYQEDPELSFPMRSLVWKEIPLPSNATGTLTWDSSGYEVQAGRSGELKPGAVFTPDETLAQPDNAADLTFSNGRFHFLPRAAIVGGRAVIIETDGTIPDNTGAIAFSQGHAPAFATQARPRKTYSTLRPASPALFLAALPPSTRAGEVLPDRPPNVVELNFPSGRRLRATFSFSETWDVRPA
jgi:hypothetical protein